MNKVALFAGSFDPFTVGHLAVVEQGLRLFDRVVIGVGVNPAKPGFLSVAARVELIREVFNDHPRVSTEAYDGLTGNFALSRGASVILRGVRAGADLDYELPIEQANEALFPDLQTVFVAAPGGVAFVSSSLVREVFAAGGDVSKFLPAGVNLKKYL